MLSVTASVAPPFT